MSLPRAFLSLTLVAAIGSTPFTARSEVTRSDVQLYGGIGALGVGALGIGLGLYEGHVVGSTKDDPAFSAYAAHFQRSDDVCDQAHAGGRGTVTLAGPGEAAAAADSCDSAKRAYTLQTVFLFTGMVFAVGGIALLVTRPPPKRESAVTVRIAPAVGPTQGGLRIYGEF